jgi:hypothetical protein
VSKNPFSPIGLGLRLCSYGMGFRPNGQTRWPRPIWFLGQQDGSDLFEIPVRVYIGRDGSIPVTAMDLPTMTIRAGADLSELHRRLAHKLGFADSRSLAVTGWADHGSPYKCVGVGRRNSRLGPRKTYVLPYYITTLSAFPFRSSGKKMR